MALSRRATITASAATTPAVASPGDNAEIIRLLEQIVAMHATWKAEDLHALEDGPGDSPRAVELDRRIGTTYDLVQQLLAIPARTASDLVRKLQAIDTFEEGRVTEDDSFLGPLMADARALAGKYHT
jgi:hypothetical protein